ncbi:BAR-domain-containing protein [Coleophoma cylindrospora]|uniref:BAR-domain-containing protein n=1 Tax=Coleophoma cylindrospora TaxID=1849047 RepID=A0A3D8SQ34_9HELO|nr:BAR-domain-containing protein [Coleophoma cylindrospora]
MNINKKFDRIKQWTNEKMGAEAKTGVSEEFKALEMEMTLRHEGMEKLQKSMTTYVKSLSKREEIEDKEKLLPVGYLAQTMINHGEDFEPDSEFGNCLIAMGRTNERISRTQETYVVNATNGWLESLERSLAMMKEYQAARKKLENRRLAYDASLSKMSRAKKEDFRVEEELRSQKAKYEESSEDVLRRMQDIKEAEAESVADLGAFLDAELEYYDRCRDELLQLKRDWPAGATPSPSQRRPNGRSRSNTAHSLNTPHVYHERFAAYEEPPTPELEPPPRPAIRSASRVGSASRVDSRLDTHDEYPDPISPSSRPSYGRSNTFQGPTSIYRETTPVASLRQSSVPNEREVGSLRASLRPTSRIITHAADIFHDPSDDSTHNSASPDHSYGERSVSPATSQGSYQSYTSRSASFSNNLTPGNARKGPPPPPPSRAKKPPPPPPMKRADISAGGISRY